MVQILSKKDAYYAGAVFFIVYLFYLFSVYPTIATEDAGEFAAVIETVGIAHPSGYPLYILLGKIFTLLVPFGNVGWQVNIFSAFCAAAAAAGVYLVVKLLSNNTWVSIATGLFFASGGIVWSQAIRAEVYSLNSLLLVALVLLTLLYAREQNDKLFLWIAFLFGLSLTNHHLMLMAGPPVALLILITQPRILLNWRLILKGIGLFALGLSLYLYLPIRASYDPAINWGDPATSEQFWQHVTRYTYSIDAVDPSLNPVTITNGTQANAVTDFFQYHIAGFWQQYGGIVTDDYTIITVILALAGFIFLFQRKRNVFWFFLALIAFYSTVLSMLIGLGITGKLPVGFFTARPFFIPLLLFTVILAGYGLHSGLRMLNLSKKSRIVPHTIVVGLALVALLHQFPQQNQSDNYIAYDIAKAALTRLPQNAVLLSENNDNTLFPILYLQTVEGLRPDVIIYIRSPINIYNFFTDFASMADAHPLKRYFTDFPFVHYNDKEYLYGGTFSQIVPRNVKEGGGATINFSPPINEIRGSNKTNLDHFNRYLLARYALDQGLAAEDNPDHQAQLFQKALETAPDSTNITAQLIGNYYVRNDRFKEALPYLQEAQQWMPDEYPINFQLVLSYIVNEQFQEARDHIGSLSEEDQGLLVRELGMLHQLDPEKYEHLTEFLNQGFDEQ